jgi:hypothetical protein
MSFIDKAKEAISDNLEKAKDLVADKVEAAIAKAGHYIDKTGDTEAVETLRIEFEAGIPLPPLGILKDMGYRVGKKGLFPHERREILRRTFRVQLVATSPWTEEYIREWGERCSPARLDKMDRVLGGLVANAERKTKADMSEAIRDWKEDREWLRNNEWLTHTHER